MKRFRLLIVESGCPHCPEVLRFINKVNLKLPFDKRIEVIDTVNEPYGINLFPILKKIKYEGVPHLIFGKIINGKIIEDMHIAGGIEIMEINEDFLRGYLGDEYLEDFVGESED